MSTIAFEFFRNFDARWSEVNILLDIAKETEDTDPKFKVLCRAATVLVVANFEGFLTETLNSIIGDINLNSYFKYTSNRMKETFCSQFFDLSEKGNDKRIRRLAEMFDELDVKYSKEPFLFENNKNPKASVIEKLFEEIGGSNFFGYISECDIEKVFENDVDYNLILHNLMMERLLSGTENFPYNINVDNIGFNYELKKPKKDCLWMTFLDETLKARHVVAHGVSLDNSLSIEEISGIIEKVKIIELSFGILVCKECLHN
jgi:hypothetical protein